ncbi:HAMP domain-containing protein, partial [Acinetobacter baumannii]
AIIDDIVARANKQNADMELLANAKDSSISIIVWCVSIAVLTFLFGGLILLVFSVVRPIKRMTEAMKRLASGDLAADVPFA